MIYFVSRHPGARDWMMSQGLLVDEVVEHIGIDQLHSGDVVIGSLPVNLAAHVCACGARYVHLTLDLPLEARGRDLTMEEMRRYGARVEEYQVRKIAC